MVVVYMKWRPRARERRSEGRRRGQRKDRGDECERVGTAAAGRDERRNGVREAGEEETAGGAW